MTLDELLEQFDEVLDSGIKIPGKKTVVDIEKLRAVVDEIRLNIPAEIKQAKGIVADRADIITNAKREADAIIRNAEERAKALVAEEEITKLAQAKAAEIISAAVNIYKILIFSLTLSDNLFFFFPFSYPFLCMHLSIIYLFLLPAKHQ